MATVVDITEKQIEAVLRKDAAWHDTRAMRCAQLAYGAANQTYRETFLAKAKMHSEKSAEATKKADSLRDDRRSGSHKK